MAEQRDSVTKRIIVGFRTIVGRTGRQMVIPLFEKAGRAATATRLAPQTARLLLRSQKDRAISKIAGADPTHVASTVADFAAHVTETLLKEALDRQVGKAEARIAGISQAAEDRLRKSLAKKFQKVQTLTTGQVKALTEFKAMERRTKLRNSFSKEQARRQLEILSRAVGDPSLPGFTSNITAEWMKGLRELSDAQEKLKERLQTENRVGRTSRF